MAKAICLDGRTKVCLEVEKKVQIACEAGYDAIERWGWELDEDEKKGTT